MVVFIDGSVIFVVDDDRGVVEDEGVIEVVFENRLVEDEEGVIGIKGDVVIVDADKLEVDLFELDGEVVVVVVADVVGCGTLIEEAPTSFRRPSFPQQH